MGPWRVLHRRLVWSVEGPADLVIITSRPPQNQDATSRRTSEPASLRTVEQTPGSLGISAPSVLRVLWPGLQRNAPSTESQTCACTPLHVAMCHVYLADSAPSTFFAGRVAESVPRLNGEVALHFLFIRTWTQTRTCNPRAASTSRTSGDKKKVFAQNHEFNFRARNAVPLGNGIIAERQNEASPLPAQAKLGKDTRA